MIAATVRMVIHTLGMVPALVTHRPAIASRKTSTSLSRVNRHTPPTLATLLLHPLEANKEEGCSTASLVAPLSEACLAICSAVATRISTMAIVTATINHGMAVAGEQEVDGALVAVHGVVEEAGEAGVAPRGAAHLLHRRHLGVEPPPASVERLAGNTSTLLRAQANSCLWLPMLYFLELT